MTGNLWILLTAGGAVVAVFVALSLLADNYNLNNIKSRTVGDGQHGTARWATEQEIRSSYALVPFRVADWRAGRNLPEAQGLVLGSRDGRKGGITALVDSDDIHCLMIGASGVGKTAYFLYPNLEYACACGILCRQSCGCSSIGALPLVSHIPLQNTPCERWPMPAGKNCSRASGRHSGSRTLRLHKRNSPKRLTHASRRSLPWISMTTEENNELF